MLLEKLLISTGVQWLVFLILPVIVYILFFRQQTSIFTFLGLKKGRRVPTRLIFLTAVIAILYLALNIIWVNKYNLATDDIRFESFQQTGLSVQTIIIWLIQSLIQTSFLEEIVFRVFVINTFKAKFGFNFSNHIQAVIFTALHILGMIHFDHVTLLIGSIMIYFLSLCFGKLVKESGYAVWHSTAFHGLINLSVGIAIFLL